MDNRPIFSNNEFMGQNTNNSATGYSYIQQQTPHHLPPQQDQSIPRERSWVSPKGEGKAPSIAGQEVAPMKRTPLRYLVGSLFEEAYHKLPLSARLKVIEAFTNVLALTDKYKEELGKKTMGRHWVPPRGRGDRGQKVSNMERKAVQYLAGKEWVEAYQELPQLLRLDAVLAFMNKVRHLMYGKNQKAVVKKNSDSAIPETPADVINADYLGQVFNDQVKIEGDPDEPQPTGILCVDSAGQVFIKIKTEDI